VVIARGTILLLREKQVERNLLSRRRGHDKGDTAELERRLNPALVILGQGSRVGMAGQRDHLAGINGTGDAIRLLGDAQS
jgi:hypothetical protein